MINIKLSTSDANLLYDALSREILDAYDEDGAYENKNSRANRLDRIQTIIDQSTIYQATNKGGKQ